MDVLLGVICTLSGVVIGALTTAAYLQARYRAIRRAVGKGSLDAVISLLNEEDRYIDSLGSALEALDIVQDEVGTTRTRVADTIDWIKNTKTELEGLRGLRQMPPTLNNDSPARKDFGRA